MARQFLTPGSSPGLDVKVVAALGIPAGLRPGSAGTEVLGGSLLDGDRQ